MVEFQLSSQCYVVQLSNIIYPLRTLKEFVAANGHVCGKRSSTCEKEKVSFLFHDSTFTRRKKDLLFEKKVHSLCNSSVEKDSQ